MRWLWLVALAGCDCGKAPSARPRVASGSAADAGVVRALSFAELRDQRALRCMLVDGKKQTSAIDAIAEHGDPTSVRAALFAIVDMEKPAGESPELLQLSRAVEVLGPHGDLEGLRMAFARIDEIIATAPGLDPRLGDDEAYRARITRDIPDKSITRAPLAWATQIAIAGDVARASAIYDAVPAADRGLGAEHAHVLAALGRTAKLRELLDAAPPKDRPMLVDAWLETLAIANKPLGDAVSEMIGTIERFPDTIYPSMDTRRVLARASDTAAVARMRSALRAAWTPDYPRKYPGAVDLMYGEILDAGSTDERAAIEPHVLAEIRDRETILRTGSLDAALAHALAYPYPDRYVARVWLRAVREGAPPQFFDQLTNKLCKGPPPVVVTPTPAAKGLQIVVTSKVRGNEEECERADVIVRLTNGEAVVDEEIYEGACQGACTAAEKRAGAKTVREIERRIERGESTESELDYDFTSCYFVGHLPGETETVGDRQIAMFAEQSMGPHSTVQTSHKLAFEVCGELFVSQAFGGRYSGGWQTENLTVEESPDKREIRVRAANDYWRGYIYRAVLPACPGVPDEHVADADY